ncbi:hypothetical protein C0989_010423, partial [Termitomyces sp. Mn162]
VQTSLFARSRTPSTPIDPPSNPGSTPIDHTAAYPFASANLPYGLLPEPCQDCPISLQSDFSGPPQICPDHIPLAICTGHQCPERFECLVTSARGSRLPSKDLPSTAEPPRSAEPDNHQLRTTLPLCQQMSIKQGPHQWSTQKQTLCKVISPEYPKAADAFPKKQAVLLPIATHPELMSKKWQRTSHAAILPSESQPCHRSTPLPQHKMLPKKRRNSGTLKVAPPQNSQHFRQIQPHPTETNSKAKNNEVAPPTPPQPSRDQ